MTPHIGWKDRGGGGSCRPLGIDKSHPHTIHSDDDGCFFINNSSNQSSLSVDMKLIHRHLSTKFFFFLFVFAAAVHWRFCDIIHLSKMRVKVFYFVFTDFCLNILFCLFKFKFFELRRFSS